MSVKTKVRAFFARLKNKLGKRVKAARPIIVAALTDTVKDMVGILQREGLEFLAALEAKGLDEGTKNERFRDWAKEYLKRESGEAMEELNLRNREIDLAKQLIFNGLQAP
jgi:hypothetical protein